jgi:uncharacterized membrane protein (UPF0127 family)
MSLRKDAMAWGFVGLLLVLVGAAAYYVLLPQLQPHVTLRIGDGVYNAKVAKTETERTLGLSETSGLRDNQALLLVYDTDAKWPIAMKDMKYSVDVVWLDKDKKAVYIVKNVPPDNYTDEQFISKKDARYIVMLPVGTVAKKSITIDSEAAFDENRLEGWGQ